MIIGASLQYCYNEVFPTSLIESPNFHNNNKQQQLPGLNEMPTKFWMEAQLVLWPHDDPQETCQHQSKPSSMVFNPFL